MKLVPAHIRAEVEDFLVQEANLLEEGLLNEWLNCFTDDVNYLMPIRRNIQPGGAKANHDGDAFSYFNDDKKSLAFRIQRLETGVAHAEAPPSVTQRLITNIRVLETEKSDEFVAHSKFLVFQERRGREHCTFIGKREDVLRREGEVLKIAKRRIDLAQTILPSTIAIFF